MKHRKYIKKVKSALPDVVGYVKEKMRGTTDSTIASATVFLGQVEILKWTEQLSKSAATIYDKALDREYLATNIGGGNHRLFDGGHDLFSAWERAREASSNDTFTQEVIGYISALWKDLTTAKGLPFSTLNKATYDDWAETISAWVPGLKKEYLSDLLSFDAIEVFSTALGAVAVLFALSKDDEKKLAEILGTMGITSIMSANPIMGVFVTAISGFAYYKQKRKLDKKAMATSASLSIVSGLIFTILGLPVLLELSIVLVVTALLKKHLFNNDEVLLIIRQNIEAAGSKSFIMLQKIQDEFAKLVSA